ncbi:MAG: hypothetical protein M1824_000033 [Vezdaea acicularis]|nr:MAG: hypothetical protein M1824_000033 [Vezdaea acicularis]
MFSLLKMLLCYPTSAALSTCAVLFCLPIALFALFTSSIAFSTLAIRVLVVYIELGMAVTHEYFFISPSPPPYQPTRPHRSSSSPTAGPDTARWTKRRSSAGSSRSDIVPGQQQQPPRPAPQRSQSGFFGLGAVGLERDFEGVGGWRFAGSGGEDDEIQWSSMNSRLKTPSAHDQDRRRKHHRRSLTSGSFPAALMTSSSNTWATRHSRARSHPKTPPAHVTYKEDGESYFQDEKARATADVEKAVETLDSQMNGSSSTISSAASSTRGSRLNLTMKLR